MKHYCFTVEETLSRVVDVVAESRKEAYSKLEQAVRDCEIVLSADDFCDRTVDYLNESDDKFNAQDFI